MDPFDINSVVIVDISQSTGEPPAGYCESTWKIVSCKEFNESYVEVEMEEIYEILESKIAEAMKEPILLSGSSMESIDGDFYSDTSEEFLGFS